jgi:hypothetical protein
LRGGYEVTIAEDGARGVAMATSDRPDLILMDMNEASIKRGRPKLAVSFILGQTCDVACWHFLDMTQCLTEIRFRLKSGHPSTR